MRFIPFLIAANALISAGSAYADPKVITLEMAGLKYWSAPPEPTLFASKME
jgi:hypothetical protein